MLRVLFITGANHKSYMVNMNHYQRVYFLSRQTRLTVFGRKDADFSLSAAEGTEIMRAPFQGKLGMIFACLYWMIVRGRFRRYDVVLTEPSKLCICGFIAKIVWGAKWIVDVWDIPFRCQSRRIWRRYRCRIDRMMARRLFRFVDLFLLSILPDMEFAEFGVPKEKIVLLKNAIWLNRQRMERGDNDGQPCDEFRILCARTCFTEDSGLDLLAEVFDDLSRYHENLRLTIVGRIPLVVERQIERLRNRSTVCFSEFMEHSELMSLMASSAACVVPFRNTQDLAQTYPIKVLEYLSCGAVVIAPDLPGIASMIKHGDNGLLFRPDDSTDLAEKLRIVHENPDYVARISARASFLSDEFDCRNKAKVILYSIEKLCQREEPGAVSTFVKVHNK